MQTHLFPLALAIIVSAHQALSVQATVKMPYQATPLAGIERSQEKAAESGIDGAKLEFLYAEVAREPHHDLKGIVIVRNGRVAGEQYFNGDSVDTLHDIRSATKSITSLLMGIAIQKGLVHGVNDSIALYLPGLPKDGKERITIKDLLNMSCAFSSLKSLRSNRRRNI